MRRTLPVLVTVSPVGSRFEAQCPCGWHALEPERKRLSYVITGHKSQCRLLKRSV